MFKRIILPILKICLGGIMAVLALTGYVLTPELFVEMTFISNFVGGVILVVDGVLMFKNKSVPSFVYRNVAVCIFFVFLICAGSLTGAYHMNFKGVFFFLHTIFPILFILMYIFFVKENKEKVIIKITTTPILMIVYLLFDFILGKIRGEFVYGFFKSDELDFLFALLIGLVFYLFLGLIGWLFLFFNSAAHPEKDNSK